MKLRRGQVLGLRFETTSCLHPDQRVKDARTGHYVGNFNSVMDGRELQGFFDAFLRLKAGKTTSE